MDDVRFRVGGDISGLNSALRKASGSMDSFINKTSKVFQVFMGAYLGSNLIDALTIPFQKGFQAVASYNQSIASLGALVMTFSKKQEGMSLEDQWKKSYEYSSAMVPILENIAARTLLSGEETTAMANAFARAGVFLDANNDKQMEAFVRLSNTIPLLTQGQAIMMQINQEIRGLMGGGNMANSMLLQTLKAIDPEIKKHLELWRAEGTVMEHIGDLLSGFGPATKILENEWQAVKSTLETTVTQILRGLMEPSYRNIIELTKDLNNWLVKNKQTIMEWGINFRIALTDIQAEVMRLAMLLDKVGGTMTSAKMLLYGPGAALGVESSTKRFEKAAEQNMMYEQRYKETDRALLKLAEDRNALESLLKNPPKGDTNVPSPPKSGREGDLPLDKATQRHAELVKKTFNDLLKNQVDYENQSKRLNMETWEQKRMEVYDWAETTIEELKKTEKFTVSELNNFSSQIEQTGLAKLKLIDAEKVKQELDDARELYAQYTDDINKLTMSEVDYQLDALQTETIAMRVKYMKNKEMLDLIAQHYNLTSANIIAESDRSSQQWLDNQIKQMKQQGATIDELQQAKWEHELRYTADANRAIEIALEMRTDKYGEEAQKIVDITLQLANIIESSITDSLMGLIEGTVSAKEAFSEMATSILKDIMRIIITKNISEPIANQASSWISTLGTVASLFHSGGIVGSPFTPKRMVSSATFMNAPRLHKGLANDEYPAILQRGEKVIPKNQSQDSGTVVQYINNFDGATFMNDKVLEDSMRTISSQMVYKLAPDVIIQDYKNDGKIRSMVRGRK